MTTTQPSTVYSKELLAVMQKIFNSQPQAISFINVYSDYAHRMDDIIDEKITDPEFVVRTFQLGEALMSSNYYQAHVSELYPILKMVSNMYLDSCILEKSNEKWKQAEADVLRHSGNEMLIAMAMIEVNEGKCSYEDMRELSLLLRCHAYVVHHDAVGNPV